MKCVPVGWDAAAAQRVLPWLQWVVRALSALVLACWVLIAAVHVDDVYAHDHAAGVWLALAQYANEGVLYPPLHEGWAFGGTRLMPLQFVLHAGVARATGEYLVSGKLLAYASALILFALVFEAARRLSRSTTIAFGLVAAILATRTGLLAGTAVRGDALPVALQLSALTLATRASPLAAVGAAVLSALAILSKSAAIWAAVAIALWLTARERRLRLPLFLVSFAAMLGLGLAVFELLSESRMSENIVGLSTSGLGDPVSVVLDGAHKFVSYAQRYANAVWLLVPLAVAGLVVAASRRRLTIYHVSFLLALLLVVVELADVGVSWNHLLDIEILTALLVAEFVGSASEHSRPILATVALTALIWGIATSFQLQLRKDAADAVRSFVAHGPDYDATPLASELRTEELILAEDPYVPVSLGRDPLVLDPYMLRQILRDNRNWRDEFLDAIHRRKFTKIVLSRRLNPGDRWWRDYHFGAAVATAFAQSYRLESRSGRYWLYAPAQVEAVTARSGRPRETHPAR